MKKLLILAASSLVAVGAFAQGTVQFVNNGTGLKAPIYGVEPSDNTLEKHGNTALGLPAGAQTYGGALLAGTGFTAQLWGNGNGPGGVFSQLASQPFRTGSAAGFVNNLTTATLNGAPLTAQDGASYAGTFVFRAFDNRGGTITTWAAVMADLSIPRGESASFVVANLGGTGTPSSTPPLLNGLVSFNLFTPVPEPSLIAIGALGLGALLLRRRKA